MGAEDVASAGHRISSAAEQMSRTQGYFDETAQRLILAMEQHSIFLDHLTTELRETRMAQLGITEEDIAETMPDPPGTG